MLFVLVEIMLLLYNNMSLKSLKAFISNKSTQNIKKKVSSRLFYVFLTVVKLINVGPV